MNPLSSAIQKKYPGYLVWAIIVLVAVFGWACTTKKNTLITRSYHNVTSYYNVYYNARESFNQGMLKLDQSLENNYSTILPIYTSGDDNLAKTIAPQMNKTIEKCSKAIRKHSITVKPKMGDDRMSPKERAYYEKTEYCKWIDDSYLLMGKANFYKHDYFAALETFNFIVRQYNNEPVKYEGIYWIARIYNEMKKYNETRQFLDQLKGDKHTPKKLDPEIELLVADYNFKQNDLEKTTQALEKYLSYKPNKKSRIRINFILAQIHQQQGKNEKATQYFDAVLKLNPPYEMAFNAQINKARLYSAGMADSRPIRKQLAKMLKDDKNIDFQDQIYYALANIEKTEGNDEKAVEYYLLSAQKSTRNNNQKAISFLALAEIYFAEPDYMKAQMFYDSTITFISKDYPQYNAISVKAATLNELVENMNTITREDSLQRVAKMDESQRNALIESIISKIKEEEERKKAEAEQNRFDAMTMQQNVSQINQQQSGKWYFYNPSALGMGRSGFLKKWGNRKLEDNWRRKNKEVVADMDGSESNSSDSAGNSRLSNTSREYYLQGLPVNDSLIGVSNKKIEEAHFNVATIYNEQLAEPAEAIKYYELMNSRFPRGIFELASYYHLYKTFQGMNNEPKAQYYKELIFSAYPQSNYARVLQNPEYFKELEKQENLVNILYAETYQLYLKNEMALVIKKCVSADSAYYGSKTQAKFALLKAMAVGHLSKDTLSFVNELKTVYKLYPKTDEGEFANEILASFQKKKEPEKPDLFATGSQPVEGDSASLKPKIAYKFNPDEQHLYVVIINSMSSNTNELKFRLSNFNLDNFSAVALKIEVINLEATLQMVVVKTIKNKNQAMNYFESVEVSESEIFENMSSTDYRHFVIGVSNFSLFLADKRANDYVEFFKQNYFQDRQ